MSAVTFGRTRLQRLNRRDLMDIYDDLGNAVPRDRLRLWTRAELITAVLEAQQRRTKLTGDAA